MDKLTNIELLAKYNVTFGALSRSSSHPSSHSYQIIKTELRGIWNELLRRLNQTDLEQFTGMLTRLGASFDSKPADEEELAMYASYEKWPTLHTIVRVYPIKNTWPLGYNYCWSEWFFDKDGKLIAQGASE